MGRIQSLHLNERKDLSIYSQVDTCSTEKGVLTTKTRLALKTKVDHKLIDLLELLLKSWKYTWERINTFPYRLGNNGLIAASVP